MTEIALGNIDSARKEPELTETLLGEHRQAIYLLDMSYAYGRSGDVHNATRLVDEIRSLAASQDIGAGGRAMASLAVGDQSAALKHLRDATAKAGRHEIDAGMFSLMNLKLNFTADPALNQPAFSRARALLKGD